MIIINYYDGKKTIEVEVTEEFAEAYKIMQLETDKINKRNSRYEIVSLEELETEMGFQLADVYADDLLVALIKQEEHEKLVENLKIVIKALTPKQKIIIKMLYQALSITEIAIKLNVSKSTISQTKSFIQKKIKKYFSKTY